MPFSRKNLYVCPQKSEIIQVGQGNLLDKSKPPYIFYNEKGNEIKKNPVLKTGIEYQFKRFNKTLTHPFYISSEGIYKPNNKKIVYIKKGSDINYQKGIKGNETLTIKILKQDRLPNGLVFYCTSHPKKMNGVFKIN